MKVLKFGGTSVQDAAALQRLFEIVAASIKKEAGTHLVVVSAMSKVTDSLIQVCDRLSQGDLNTAQELMKAFYDRQVLAARELNLPSESLQKVVEPILSTQALLPALASIAEVSPRMQDRIVSLGEVVSSLLVAESFIHQKLSCQWLDSREIVKTDSHHGSAAVDFPSTQTAVDEKLGPLVGRVDVLVCGGFIGSDLRGVTTTLGRGGSDYSASVLGAATGAKRIEIWTDVDGVLTTDPRLVKEARPVHQLSFDEASELAYFGAKVLHPATIFPAVEKKIPVVVLNSKNPAAAGTLVTHESSLDSNIIKAIAFKKNVTLVNIHSSRMLGASGFLKSIYDVFARHNISVDLISTSEVSVSMTLDSAFDPESLQKALEEISTFAKTSLHSGKSTVSTVGSGIRHSPGITARIFQSIRAFNVSMISMGASEVNVSFVVDDRDLPDVVSNLHQEFFETPNL